MQPIEMRRAVVAAMATATECGLAVDDAVILNDSNRLVFRLTPCDVVARVSSLTHQWTAEREVELVRRLAETDSPVAALDPRVEPRVFVRDDFEIAMWTYYESVQTWVHPPGSYAQTLEHLHAGLRQIDVTVPHFMDRVAAAKNDVANHDVTPDLIDTDRTLLADTLHDLSDAIVERGAPEQLLHGEPHPG